MWWEEYANQEKSMMTSEQSHVTTKYHVFVYNEEVKDGRMIILPWKIGNIGLENETEWERRDWPF